MSNSTDTFRCPNCRYYLMAIMSTVEPKRNLATVRRVRKCSQCDHEIKTTERIDSPPALKLVVGGLEDDLDDRPATFQNGVGWIDGPIPA